MLKAVLYCSLVVWPNSHSLGDGKEPNVRTKLASLSHKPLRGGIWEANMGFAVFTGWESWAQVPLKRASRPSAALLKRKLQWLGCSHGGHHLPVGKVAGFCSIALPRRRSCEPCRAAGFHCLYSLATKEQGRWESSWSLAGLISSFQCSEVTVVGFKQRLSHTHFVSHRERGNNTELTKRVPLTFQCCAMITALSAAI